MIQIDMPIPKNCIDCPACNEYLMCAIPCNGRGWGENDVKDFSQSRPEWCPMKEQEEQKRKWLQTIADTQLAVSPTGYETDEELAKRTGEWNGLQMAWEIITGEERSEHPHIVRCKDCLHFVHVRTDAIGHCTKDISCWVFRDMNWFCADGKKEQTD